jgi:hypothetical protein
MDREESAIQRQVVRYRGIRALNLMKAGSLVLCGLIMLYLAASGDLFPEGGLPESATLGRALGEQGVMAVALGIGILVIGIGLIWGSRLVRDLRVGIKEYEAALHSGAYVDG